MKKENDIKVEIIRVTGDLAPFVMVDYMDKEAQEHSGLMLLDSGSNYNILARNMADHIGELCKLEGEPITIETISQDAVFNDHAKFSFAMGGNQYQDTFVFGDLPCHKVEDCPVIGLIGNIFMQQHNLVLDYNDFTLHTSNVSPDNLTISDCDFFFPMEIGLKFYGIPVLSVKQNGKELVTLVDSGATCNMIARQSLSENDFRCQHLEEKDIIKNIAGEIDVDKAIVWFNMLSLDSDDVCEISRHDHFMVLPCPVFVPKEGECDTNGDQLPPVEVVLGSPFMAKEGWTLDFGAKIMYKLKVA